MTILPTGKDPMFNMIKTPHYTEKELDATFTREKFDGDLKDKNPQGYALLMDCTSYHDVLKETDKGMEKIGEQKFGTIIKREETNKEFKVTLRPDNVENVDDYLALLQADANGRNIDCKIEKDPKGNIIFTFPKEQENKGFKLGFYYGDW